MITRIFLLVLFFTSYTSQSQSTASAQVHQFTIEAPELQTEKNIWIYLPINYRQNNGKYEVIYMHDAQNLFDHKTSYVGEWEVDETLDSIADNRAIIVGIAHGNEKRMEELTPFPNDKYGGGQAEAYLQFIIKTLKPYIDQNYRTFTDAKHTSIFGSSLGGLLSFYAVIKYPEIFGNAGVFSPSFWFSNRIFDFVKQTPLPPESRFYFLVGSEESDAMVPDQQKMVKLLLEKGLKKGHIKSNIIDGGRHNETLWRNNFADAYLWLTDTTISEQ